jgi:hypothetical protein
VDPVTLEELAVQAALGRQPEPAGLFEPAALAEPAASVEAAALIEAAALAAIPEPPPAVTTPRRSAVPAAVQPGQSARAEARRLARMDCRAAPARRCSATR